MTARVAILGVKGGPAIRPGSNMPTSLLVRMGGKRVLVDAGLGASRGVCDQGVALPDIDLVLVTHLHSDHYLELGPYFHTAWVAGLTDPIPVIGPVGLGHYWKHFIEAMSFDVELRIADEGRVPLAPLCALETIGEGVVYDDGRLRVSAMRNDHPPIEESYALRLEADGKALVLSGDTAHMDRMAEFARGADLLVHEAMLVAGVEAVVNRIPNGDERLLTHILRSHTAAHDVGRIASAAGVGALALNHFVPDGDPDYSDADWEREVRRTWEGPLHIARDGMVIDF